MLLTLLPEIYLAGRMKRKKRTVYLRNLCGEDVLALEGRGSQEEKLFLHTLRTELVQKEFDNLVEALRGRCWGFIKQLKDAGAAAMRAEEIEFFRFLLDESGLARMSYGYLRKQENGRDKAVITEGPLQYFEDRIVKVDRHNRCAWMDFAFMGRKVQAGLTIENAPGKPVCPKEAVCGEGGTDDRETGKARLRGRKTGYVGRWV